MQPGGKIEIGEMPVEALGRELFEELAIIIEPADVLHLGRYTTPAANEACTTVTAELFALTLQDAQAIAAEIVEMIWLDPGEGEHGSSLAPLCLAPLTRDAALPLWRARLSRG
jgi:8-oxo-dGTP pyrophosphatase MutT (NUDIX family)